MIVKDLSTSFNPYPKSDSKTKKSGNGVNYTKGKKHTRTKKTDISKKVKEIVWERDKHKCIICGKWVPVECACCHYIPRSSGGLGIPENVYTGCSDCHREQDNGLNTKLYDSQVKKYLKRIYGTDWNEKKLIYKKNSDN